jgi:hypothetical protein
LKFHQSSLSLCRESTCVEPWLVLLSVSFQGLQLALPSALKVPKLVLEQPLKTLRI